MDVLNIVLGVILLIAAIFLIIAVLMQQGKSKGMGAVGGGSSETFFGKTKSKGWDKKLAKLTTIVGIVFVVIVLAVYVIQDDADYDKFFEDNSSLLENPVEETEKTEEEKKPEETNSETSEETKAETAASTQA